MRRIEVTMHLRLTIPLLAVFLALPLEALAQPSLLQDNAAKPRLPKIHSKAECLAVGGKWGWNGIPRGYEPDDKEGFCILATQDAGKPCSSSRECQGMCEATQDSATTKKGVCTSSNFTAGCRSWVEGGIPSPVLCAD